MEDASPEIDWTPLYRAVRDEEGNLRYLRHEKGLFFNQLGNVILIREAEPEAPLQITFSSEDVAFVIAQRAEIFTHNHPRGWDYPEKDVRHQGHSFSPDDLMLACQSGIREVRAETPIIGFSVRKTEHPFTIDDWRVIEVVFAAEYERTNRRLALAALRGEITPEEVDVELLHQTWEQCDPLLGWRYERWAHSE